MKGTFITFEGSEGSGKSTQIRLIEGFLKTRKRKVFFLREPGGVKISEKIRGILLDVKNKGMSRECETLLYMAARAQLMHEAIIPALQRGEIVLCDRFLDSTLAYQGYGNGVDLAVIRRMGRFATGEIAPDLTLIFDIEASMGLSRIKRAKDRIEQRPLSYHERVRQGYLEIARREPRRIKVVPVTKSKEEIHAIVKQYVQAVIERKK